MPISDRTIYLTQVFFGTTICLFVVSIPLLGRRIYTRMKPFRMEIDDWLIVIGAVSNTEAPANLYIPRLTNHFQALTYADWIMLLLPLVWFLGPQAHALPVTRIGYGYRLAYLAIIVWAWSMAAIKSSIALTLMRFLRSPAWRIFLYALIGVQTATAVAVTFFLTLQCRPIYYAWSQDVPKGACWGPENIKAASNATSAINIATDIILSFVPLVFLMKLQRPLRERVLLAVLMAMALMACIASVMKTVTVQHYSDPTEDIMDLNVAIPTWTLAEEFLALIAALLPTLKMPIQNVLGRMGWSVTTGYSHGSASNRSKGISKENGSRQRTGFQHITRPSQDPIYSRQEIHPMDDFMGKHMMANATRSVDHTVSDQRSDVEEGLEKKYATANHVV